MRSHEKMAQFVLSVYRCSVKIVTNECHIFYRRMGGRYLPDWIVCGRLEAKVIMTAVFPVGMYLKELIQFLDVQCFKP